LDGEFCDGGGVEKFTPLGGGGFQNK